MRTPANFQARRSLRLLLLAGVLAASGCSTVQYYGQAVVGQARLLADARDIESLLESDSVPPDLARRLERIRVMLRFAFDELHLPDNGSYRRYTVLDRRHIVWNVFATPRFSVEPLTWCYPVAGCVAYRGYFSEDGARRFGARVAADGNDVFVGGVDAYSTLGRLSDPVLSTFIDYSEGETAALLFHELAHQLIYVKDDTVFNESFATAVEEYGVQRWFDARGDAAGLAHYRRQRAYSADLAALMISGKARLREAYADALPPSLMARRKVELLDHLYDDYVELEQRYRADANYRRFERADFNNALVASFDLYHRYLPAFRLLLERSNGDLMAFYEQVRALGDKPADERGAALAELMPRSGEA